MPLSQLIYWVSLTWKNVVDQEFFMLIYRSFSLAIGSAIIIALLSIFLLYAVRLSPLKWTKYITKVSSIGYAIPGAVIAVGVMIPMIGLDRFIIKIIPSQTELLFSGSFFIVIIHYILRIMTVEYNSIDAEFEKTIVAGNK